MGKYEGREGRRILRAYLVEHLKKYEYDVGEWRANSSIYIKLNTKSWDPIPVKRTWVYQPQPDIVKFVLRGSALCYCGSDGESKIASTADPECAAKIASFVKDLHLSLLEIRKNNMQSGVGIIDEEISRLEAVATRK